MASKDFFKAKLYNFSMKKIISIMLLSLAAFFANAQDTKPVNIDVLFSAEYFRPASVDYGRFTANVGAGKNFYLTEKFGLRAETMFHISFLQMIMNPIEEKDDDNTNTKFGYGWSISAGPVCRFDISENLYLETSVLLQELIAKNYITDGNNSGVMNALGLGGELLFRYRDKDFGLISAGVAGFWNFHEYFFKSGDSYSGGTGSWAIRPMIAFSIDL